MNQLRFAQPRYCMYARHTGQYGEKGWVNEPTEATILGIWGDIYITRFYQSEETLEFDEPEWHYEYYPCTTWIGIHKSRFIKWVDKPKQLQLF